MVAGPLRRMVTAPLAQMAADREQLLARTAPSGTVTVTLAGATLDVPLDLAAVEQLVETAYRLDGWGLIADLRWQLFVLPQLDPGRAITAEAIDGLVAIAVDRLRGRVARALAEADRQIRVTALAALRRSAEEATPKKVGLIRTQAGWQFQAQSAPASLTLDHAQRCIKARNEERRIRRLYIDVVNAAIDKELSKRSDVEPGEQEKLRQSYEPRLQRALRESPGYQAALRLAVETRLAAAKTVWLLDRCADDLPLTPDDKDGIAAVLGGATEQVTAANAKMRAAIEAAGPVQDAGDAGSWARSPRASNVAGQMAWLEAPRPEVNFAKERSRELGAWHYPALVESSLDAIGFVPGTFGWVVAQNTLEELRFWEKTLDEVLDKIQIVTGLLALVPHLRGPAAAVLAIVAVIRIYRRWTSPGDTEWWALIDPSSSLHAHPPSMISLLIDSGFDVLDVGQIVPVSKLLAAAKRQGRLFAVLGMLAGSRGPAADLARFAVRHAEKELVQIVAEGSRLHAASRAASEVTPALREIKVATEAVPARPRPPAPANPFDTDLARRISTLAARMGADAAAHEQDGQDRPREVPLPKEKPRTVTAAHTPKKRPKRRRRPGPQQKQEKARAKAGVKLAAQILINKPGKMLQTGGPFDEIELIVGDSLDPPRTRHRLPAARTLVDPDLAEALLLRGTEGNRLGLNWLHGAGPTWGVDIKPRFLGPTSFNLSAQARVENLVRRLKNSYLSDGHRIVVNIRQYGFTARELTNGERFIREVRYEISLMSTAGQRERVATIALKAANPRRYALTGEIYAATDAITGEKAIIADVWSRFEDAIGSAAEWSDPLMRFQ